MHKYAIRRNGRLYDTDYRNLGVAKCNARSWCEQYGGLWQVFKLTQTTKKEIEVYSIEKKDK